MRQPSTYRPALAALLLAAGTLIATAPAAPAAPAGGDPAGVAPSADFDGDGHADLVVTAPHAAVSGHDKAGYVAVVYGSSKGTDVDRRQVFTQGSEGIPGDPADDVYWGWRTVARDLDGDGVTDLAVHGSGDSSVTVLWGATGDGLGGATVLPDGAGVDGHNLVGGDFNGDGHADLVAGSSGSEEWGDLRVLYGPFGRDGQAAGSGDLHSGRVFAPVEAVAGDVTGDGADDLITLHAFEEMSEKSLFWQGGPDGVSDEPTRLPDAAAATVGDVDGDGFGDLVIRTVPGGVVENLPYDHGTVKVLYGASGGPGASGRTTTLTQNSAGVPGTNEDGDQFGHDLAAGDVDGDGTADIAVGVPFEDLAEASQRDTGSIVLLKGSGDGLSGEGARAFHQAKSGVPGIAESRDHFGWAVTLQDTDGDGRRDLGIGTPGEDSVEHSDMGSVWVLRGTSGGLTTDGVVSFGPGALSAAVGGERLGTGFSR